MQRLSLCTMAVMRQPGMRGKRGEKSERVTDVNHAIALLPLVDVDELRLRRVPNQLADKLCPRTAPTTLHPARNNQLKP